MNNLKNCNIYAYKTIINNEIIPACISLRNGKIDKIRKLTDEETTWKEEFKKKSNNEEKDSITEWYIKPKSILFPGIVDSHVHVNEPGRTEWEGFKSVTKAAAAGGITTIADMPLNSIPSTVSLKALNTKKDAAKGKCTIDVAFLGGVVPDNANVDSNDIEDLVKEGIAGFKCFLINSGVESFKHVEEDEARVALKKLGKQNGLLMFHAEVDIEKDAHVHADKDESKEDPMEFSTFLKSRPTKMENNAISMVLKLCKETKTRCHIVHLSSSDLLPDLKKAKEQDKLPLTIETCFHYLFFDSDTVPKGATQYKCCPPIRTKKNQEALWKGLKDGTIDCVVSDHSPCTAKLKEGDFMSSWGGIASVQFGLSIIYQEAKERGFDEVDIVRWMCENTAKLIGLDHKKGKIAVGYDGDLCVFDPDLKFNLADPENHHKNKVTPYKGVERTGKVTHTILRGNLVYPHVEGPTKGEFLKRKYD